MNGRRTAARRRASAATPALSVAVQAPGGCDLGGPAAGLLQWSRQIMTNLPTLARLRELNRALETAVRMTKELAGNRAFEPLAAHDPKPSNLLLDPLTHAIEPGQLGSPQLPSP